MVRMFCALPARPHAGRRRLELGQLLVAHVNDVGAELTVQQLEFLADHEDG
jgi:hypothetical protein